MWKKESDEYASAAKVVDGNLIISLPDAINPVVWRMELGSVKASALEVRKNAADNSFVLTLKTPKGDVHDIAPYERREGAVTALMRVSSALQGAEGKIAPGASYAALPPTPQDNRLFVKPDSSTLKWLVALTGVLVVIFLFAYLSRIGSDVETSGVPVEETATSVTGQPDAESGVPQSADDLLRGY